MYKLQVHKFEELRKIKNISQELLSKNAGISLMTYRRLIEGKDVKLSTIQSISEFYKVSPTIWWKQLKDETVLLSEPKEEYGCKLCRQKDEMIKLLEDDRELLKSSNKALQKCINHLPAEKKT